MRWFAWCLMAVAGLLVGCNEPIETIPSIEPEPSSGVTDSGDHEHGEGEHSHDHGEHGHDHGDHDHDHGEGDHDHGEADHDGEEGAAEGEDSASKGSPEAIRFVADKSIKVPGMMCPYSCWPNVEKTLAGLPGVEGVQLAQQPEGTAEGEIKERVVELKLGEDFDAEAAIAALSAINFEAEVVN